MNKNKQALFHSVVAMLLCISMLIGATFAWFTDSVASTANVISTGTLNVGLYHTNAAVTSETEVTNETKNLFQVELWEPGVATWENFTVKNEGSLWLKYQLGLNALDVNYVEKNGARYYLAEVLTAGVVPGGVLDSNADGTISREEAIGQVTDWVALNDVMEKGNLAPEGEQDSTIAYGVVVRWEPGENDNNLNVNNGSTTSDGNPLTVDLGVTLAATQFSREEDSFGPDYDTPAEFPELELPVKVTVTVPNDGSVTTEDVTMVGRAVSATVPAGVKLQSGKEALTLTVTEKESSQANVTTGATEDMVSLDVHIDGVDAANDKAIIVDLGPVMPKYLNIGNYRLYHVENGATTQMTAVATLAEVDTHNEFYYDLNTGNLTVAMATFSEVAVVADTDNAWKGEFKYDWYDADEKELTIANADQLAGFSAIVGGMNGQTRDSFSGQTVKLIADINLGDAEVNNNEKIIFYPIGYYNSTESYEKSSGGSVTSGVSSFEGTFDGQGHTIANFYQNTWEMFGDYNNGYTGTPNHYKDAMGLFGYVYGGTVQNLTVDNFSSDGEFTPTGVIAAYADGKSTFANIAITNCNPRVYNTGNGGIIGIAGDTSAANDDHITLTNITVDNSNKISALWGSWDVACGGLVGMYRGNVDANGNATGDTISFNNCHVSAQIDVYNDVCANYQYYAYRYAGMMIGSVRHNTKDGDKTIPNMKGIKATGCTVNYGDWNDYYYCEFEKNTMASYSEDYQFSRVPHSELKFTDSNGNGVVDADERSTVTGCKHTHTAEENHQAIYLPFHQLFTGYSWGVSSVGLKDYSGITIEDFADIKDGITEGDQEESVEKFETKFTGDFLYRVGNKNTVALGSLFAAKEDVTISDSGVVASIVKVDESSNVSGTFAPDTSDWTKGTIQFSGTGLVDVTIQDYNFCKPTTLRLEVVDAVNAITATSATANNVVLLNDCGFSSLEVSGGYSLYGNGFTMTCSSDSAASDMGYSFVTLNSGTLDNVQIVCPNFDYAALYKSNLTSTDNRSETDANGKTRYYNAKSGVMASGNSQILNSRVSGARAAVNVSGGNVVIDNSRIERGAVASVLVGAANSLTLRDVTLIQKPTASTYDSSKTLMGFSVLAICDVNGDSAPITLEGTLVQNAWVDESDKQYVPSAGQSIVTNAMKQTDYLHDLDMNGTKESLNLGIAYMPESLTSGVNATTITDNRTNKDAVPYDYAKVAIANGSTYVYSYKNTSGTADDTKTESEYKPNAQSDIISVTYSDTADGLSMDKTYGTDGWVYELNVDLDKLSDYAVDFSKLSMSVNGVMVNNFTVDGNAKPTTPIAVGVGGVTYVLSATTNGASYNATFKVIGTETSKEGPQVVQSNYGTCLLVGEKGTDTTWSAAAPALEGIQVKYWSVAEKQYKTITLSDYTPTTAGAQNGTNAFWTYTGPNNDFTLTITNTEAVHSSNSVYAMPVVCDSKLYFVITSSKGLVSTSSGERKITLKYEFEDNNGDKEEFSNAFAIEYNSSATLYDYSEFCEGTLTEAKTDIGNIIPGLGGDSCVTPDTLVTMADGSKKEIQQVSVGENVVAWNFKTGAYEVVPVSLCQIDGSGVMDVLHLNFEDGTTLKVLGEHGIFDADLNNFIFIDIGDVDNYVGHRFIKKNGDGFETVKLVDYQITTEETKAYTILSVEHYNVMLEDMFTVTPAHVGGNFFNPFEIFEGLKYDEASMQADIEKYGLYTYEDFDHVLTYEQFVALNIPQFKVSVGKGLVTYEGLIYLIRNFINR